MEFNVFFVGCGRIFQKHIDALYSLKKNGYNIKKIAITDLNKKRVNELSKKFNLEIFDSLEDFKERNNKTYNIVSILTPSGLHAQNVISLSNFVKNIIVEKPMALKLSDADEMIYSCANKNTSLFVVKQNRFNKPVLFSKKMINDGHIGKLNIITSRVRWCREQSYYDQADWRGTWKFDGGVLSNQASHHIDIVEWFGGKVKSVYSQSKTFGVDIETEDTAFSILEFENGALGSVEASTAIRPKNLEGSISLIGEKGYIIIGGTAVNKITDMSLDGVSKDEIKKLIKDNSYETESVYGNGHILFYKNAFESIKNSTAPLIDGIEGRKSVELINAMYKSIENNKKIDLSSELMDTKLGNN
tara:strand:- start:13463 stop:14539 length:1077 start_codon:yes stop_codon:yes gene_type:complete